MNSNSFPRSDVPVAVVGMSCRLPGAADAEGFWKVISEQIQTERPVPPERLNRELHYQPERGVLGKTYSDLACLIDYRPLDFERFPHLKQIPESSDIAHQTLCEVAAEAVENAGIRHDCLRGQNVGVYVGHTRGSGLAGDLSFTVNVAQVPGWLKQDPTFRQLPPHLQDEVGGQLVRDLRAGRAVRDTDGKPNLQSYYAASLITDSLGLRGPYLCFNSACASSLNATVQAIRALQLGTIDAALVGGASYYHSDTAILFSQAQSLSGAGSRPFDADADGLIIGEGYVVLMLQTLDRALADGHQILGILSGAGISSDGKGKSLWAPREQGQILAIQRAYRNGLDPEQLQYIEAHATSTQVGDETEVRAISTALEGRFPKDRQIPISSVKANVGHTLEVAGLTGLMKVLLCLKHQTIPATTGVKTPNSSIPWQNSPFLLPDRPIEWTPRTDGRSRRAAVNAFGIGGLNVHLIVDDLPEPTPSQIRVPASIGNNSVAVKRTSAAVEPIAILGTGAVLPGARTASQFWEQLQTGKRFLSEAPAHRWPRELYVRPNTLDEIGSCPHTQGGYINDFEYDWKRHKIPPKQLQNASPLQFMILDSVDQALQEAGIELTEQTRRRTAVIVGNDFGGAFSHQIAMGLKLPEMCEQLRKLLEIRAVSPASINSILEEFHARVLSEMPALLDETGSFTSSSLASRITKSFDLMGGAFAIDAGMVGAGASLNCGIDLLRSGDCDLMICVAGSENLSPSLFEAWSRKQYLLQSPNTPPLGPDSAGCVPAEGCTAFVLKRLSDAVADDDRMIGIIHAVGTGTGENLHEASKNAATAAWKSLAQRSELPALSDRVQLIEVATMGDREFGDQQLASIGERYRRTLKQRKSKISSCVGQIGHLSAASGGAAMLHALQALNHKQYPPDSFTADQLRIEHCDTTADRPDSETDSSPRLVDDGTLAAIHFSNAPNHSYHILIERGTRGMTEASYSPSTENELRSVIDGVIHFDATANRRQAMRNRSAVPNVPETATPEQTPVSVSSIPEARQTHSPQQNGTPSPVSAPLSNAATLPPQAVPPESITRADTKPRMSPEELDSFLVNFVVEQTGYPEEIVELDADLEADLGIDSIKKAQLFGELSEHFDVTPDETLSLDDFPTLRHVKEYLSKEDSSAANASPQPESPTPPVATVAPAVATSSSEFPSRPAAAAVPAARAASPQPASNGSSTATSTKMSPEELDSYLVNFVVEQTGYPEEIVELDADLEADLGIDSIKKAQLFGELSEHFDVTPDETLSLDDFPTLRHVKDYLLING